MTTPTPETDANLLHYTGGELLTFPRGLRAVVDADFTRKLERERDGWKDTAARSQRDADYYRNLVVCCGNAIGEAAKTCDDGTKSEDVLCAKVPEVVLQIVSERDAWKAKATRTCHITHSISRFGFDFHVYACGGQTPVGVIPKFCSGCGGEIKQ